LGSTVATSNSSGNFSGQEWYHAYGRYRGGHELGSENRFTGQKLDATGLMYYNARYYDPELGHFISPDTLVPDPTNLLDYNRYMYTRGNPMKYTDPTGHICVPFLNVGNTCEGGTNWDAVQNSLDATGIVDPTPVSDGANAVISVVRGNYADAGWSLVAVVPVIGDLGKGGKYLDEAMAGARWVGDKADEGWQAAKRWTDCLINSFSAKTLVMTPGGLKAISELVEGELVLAYNETTGEIGAYPITDVISHVDPEIVLLTIDGETLETTAEHPFYELESAPWLAAGETEGRWTDALELQAGDRVWKADGVSGVVQSVEVAPVPQRMYNLTVAEAHTFFVGEQQWLVHNCNPQNYLNDALRQQGLSTAPANLKQKWSDNGFDYEVRIHAADPNHGKSGSIYRVARRQQGMDANGQGFGWEYLDDKGNWHHTSTLKPNSPTYNPQAAADTHIEVP
jgi:RHS repeat-associated protein